MMYDDDVCWRGPDIVFFLLSDSTGRKIWKQQVHKLWWRWEDLKVAALGKILSLHLGSIDAIALVCTNQSAEPITNRRGIPLNHINHVPITRVHLQPWVGAHRVAHVIKHHPTFCFPASIHFIMFVLVWSSCATVFQCDLNQNRATIKAPQRRCGRNVPFNSD